MVFTSDEYVTFTGTDLTLTSDGEVRARESVGKWFVVGCVDVTCGVEVSD